MIPSLVARQVRETILDYLRTTFNFADGAFEEELFAFLDGPEGLFRGPFYEIRLPFREASPEEEIPLEVRPGFVPYRHQLRAFERLHSSRGHQPQHTLITTGTGSGKTECFLYPILDHCLRHHGEPGVKAILLYPMNALATDQARRLARILWEDERLRGKVTAGLYVGGKGQHGAADRDHLVDMREVLRSSPPDILLSNYRMLDFLLLRPEDRSLWQHNGAETLRYVVLDELHTYDGAQGSDVACLLRRLKSRLGCSAGSVCCVGTSATIGGGANEATSRALRSFANQVFEEHFPHESVITEDRCTIAETLGPRVDLELFPPRERIRELDPKAIEDRAGWLKRQAELWLGGGFGEDLAERLERHEFLRELLAVLDGAPRSFEQIDERLRVLVPPWEQFSAEERRWLLDSFLALVSTARRKSKDGKRAEPFLRVHVHLWTRELRQLLRRVPSSLEERPAFRWFSDNPEAGATERRQWLPMVFCRECGFHGLAAVQLEASPRLECEPERIGRAWFDRARTARAIALGAGSPEERRLHLCAACLSLPSSSACSCGRSSEPATVPIRLVDAVSSQTPPRFLEQCPDCGSEHALSILGSRAASLLSVAVSQLFLSEHNDDKKLLAFTDSVQDASHRAGFFGNRTYTFNLRTAIQGTLEARSEDLPLVEAADRLLDHWLGRVERPKLLALLLPPDLTGLPAYKRFRRNPEGRHEELARQLLERLSWEITLEYGLNARVGRTLEHTLCSTLALDERAFAEAAEILRLDLEQQGLVDQPPLQGFEPEAIQHFLRGLLHRTRMRGGIDHAFLGSYIKGAGNWFLLTRRYAPLLSPFGRDSVLPRFLVDRQDGDVFDSLVSPADRYTWYRDWAERCLGIARKDSGINELYLRAVRRLTETGVLAEHAHVQKGSGRGARGGRGAAWGLAREKLRLTRRIARLACPACRRSYVVPAEEVARWAGRLCPHWRCLGRLEGRASEAPSYYSRIYRSGRLERIFCHEHTGLLKRQDRELVEERFKAGSAPGAPNLLVATPTLEMGIDIGDLSAAVMCSVPPAPANYQQRLGRAGRRTGNALSFTMAVTRPHDLYFHAQPLEMLAGQVLPPGCFLDAPEMLRRQLLAFAMDTWARESKEAVRIPNRVSFILGERGRKIFPGAFLEFFRQERQRILDGFLERFGAHVSSENQARLREYGAGETIPEQVQGVFEELRREQAQMRHLQQKLLQRIRVIEADPDEVDDLEDAESEVRELQTARKILTRLLEELGHKYPLSVLTDGGLLPNYAFPESGVVLQSIVTTKASRGKSSALRYHTFEYMRPASAAIRELAPFNTFYAEGRKVRIGEIDIGTRAQPLLETWRLCAACSYVERELAPPKDGERRADGSDEGDGPGVCPRCQDPRWSDSGQVRSLVPFRRSRAITEQLEATAAVAREDREEAYYRLEDLIDVGPDNYAGARVIEELPFGYELLRNVTLREVNFGPQSSAGYGTNLQVAGRELNEQGFQVCLDCGRVHDPRAAGEEKRAQRHAPYCRARKEGNAERTASLYLYREMRSEAIRILLPVLEVALHEKRASFKAALELGFRRHFRGDPGHLQLKFMDEPVPSTGGRRQFLVVYDAVPGGTGYLSELWHGEKFVEVLERALEALETCECQRQGKDGCYRCLYAYQVQRDLPLISSREAQGLLRKILHQRESFAPRHTLSEVDLDVLIESELERKFLAMLAAWAETREGASLEEIVKDGELRWILRLAGRGKGRAWEIRAQADLGPAQGVAVASRPDFLLLPLDGDPEIRPVAVFCDGFTYHACPAEARARIADDLCKRSALVRSGSYCVWTLTWRDLGEPGSSKAAGSMLAGIDAKRLAKIAGGLGVGLDRHLRESGSFEILRAYLERPEVEQWRRFAQALAGAWWATGPFVDEATGDRLELRMLEDGEGFQAGPIRSEAVPREGASSRYCEGNGWTALARLSLEALRAEDFESTRVVLRLFDEATRRQTDGFESSWRAFLHAWNLLQFHDSLEVLCSEGLGERYAEPGVASSRVAEPPDAPLQAGLGELLELATEASKPLLIAACEASLSLPELDFELPGGGAERSGAQADLAWPGCRLAVLADSQLADREAFEEAGWKVFSYPVDVPAVLAVLAACLSATVS